MSIIAVHAAAVDPWQRACAVVTSIDMGSPVWAVTDGDGWRPVDIDAGETPTHLIHADSRLTGRDADWATVIGAQPGRVPATLNADPAQARADLEAIFAAELAAAAAAREATQDA